MRTPKEYVAKDGTVTYQVRFRNGRGRSAPQETETFDDEDAALKFCRELDALGPDEAVKRLYATTRPDVPRLDEVAEDHIAHLTKITEGTREDYRRLWERTWAKHLGNLPADAITEDAVAKAVLRLARTYGRKSLANQKGLLSAVCQRAVRKGYLSENPCPHVGLPDDQDDLEEMTFLTPAEFELLIEHVPEHWQPVVYFLAGTGARWGEVAALRVGDVHLDPKEDEGKVSITRAVKRDLNERGRIGAPKTKKSRRTVDLPERVVEMLRPLVAGKARTEFLFVGPQGARLSHQNFWMYVWRPSVWKAQHCEEHREKGCRCASGRPSRCKLHESPPPPCGCAGTLDKSPRIHDLRHTHCSWLIAAGVPLPVIQVRLGHESILTTVGTYGHLSPDAQLLAAKAAGVAFQPSAPDTRLAISAGRTPDSGDAPE